MIPRHKRRDSWSALLAVLLGALASFSAMGLNASFAGGLSIAEHGADVRTTGKAASVRPDAFEPTLKLGGPDGDDAALHPRGSDAHRWADVPRSVLRAAFGLPVSIALTRDGRTRAPPTA